MTTKTDKNKPKTEMKEDHRLTEVRRKVIEIAERSNDECYAGIRKGKDITDEAISELRRLVYRIEASKEFVESAIKSMEDLQNRMMR